MRILRNSSDDDTPEINLIPLIDILLVIVIFLVVNTTFIKQSELNVQLPGAESNLKTDPTSEPLIISVGRDGNYGFNQKFIADEVRLRNEITLFMASVQNTPDNELRAVIEADASATHQSVVTVMDILSSLGISRVSIATASSSP
jgi:biopolymer transport protein ExbD